MTPTVTSLTYERKDRLNDELKSVFDPSDEPVSDQNAIPVELVTSILK